MADVDVRKIPANARLRLVALHAPGEPLPRHGSKHAECLSWVLMSRTMGDYRAKRAAANLSPNGGYIGHFIRSEILKVE